MPIDTAALIAEVSCGAGHQAWTDTPGSNENKPMNCLSWYTAFAFCAWDGGFLPTEAEWNYAASGGAEQRAYPWSIPAGSVTIDCTFANYGSCTGPSPVGTRSPMGDARWGHADLAGSVAEWVLDTYATEYPTTSCDDCANLTPGNLRSQRGGGFQDFPTGLRAARRYFDADDNLGPGFGVRCARLP